MLKAHRLADGRQADSELEGHGARQSEKLKRQCAKIKAFLKETSPMRGPRGKERKSNVTDNDSAKLATGKGVIQGYTGVAVTDARHQIIVEAQAHGVPQEQELLKPVLEGLQESFQELDLCDNILTDARLSADSGFHSGENLEWLAAQHCDAYVADNLFRKRDPRFVDADQYKPPRPPPEHYRPNDFSYDPDRLTCVWPANKSLYRNGANVRINGRCGIKFSAPKSACGPCRQRARCLKDPGQKSARQVVFFREPAQEADTVVRRMREKISTAREGGCSTPGAWGRWSPRLVTCVITKGWIA